MITLRPYQNDASNAVLKEFETVGSTLIVVPTGGGKTVIFADVIRCFQPRRAMVLAHREELITQACERIHAVTGLACAVEMADQKVHPDLFGGQQVIVSTIQTQCAGANGGRMTKFKPEDFGLLIIDEAHHGCADSYKRVIAHYRRNPALKVLGVTATPDRTDELALGQVFETVAFDYEILDAINDGYLVPIDQQMIRVDSLDFSHVKTTAGDLNGAQLAELMEREENMQKVAAASLEIIGTRRTLVFTASVKQAEQLSEIFNRHRYGMSEWVCGATPKDKRKELLGKFASGNVQVCCNCAVLCLDASTEILTSEGWIGIDGMTASHKVANWENGNVWFSEPKGIVRRERLPEERMVVLETKNKSIRVTEQHRMLYRERGHRPWRIVHAIDLVGTDGELPVSGVAAPLMLIAANKQLSTTTLKRGISTTSYNLRKRHGFSEVESKREAARRILRIQALTYTQPAHLTLEDCEFIGFWIGDGARCNLQSGGVEYTLCQWSVCQNIIARVDFLIKFCGFDVVKRSKVSNGAARSEVTTWSLPRGTGSGCQERNGVFRIEPFLTKDPNPLLWALNQFQFAALLKGYWMADGCNHRDDTLPPENIRICGAREALLSSLQAIACVRGYRASLIRRPNGKHYIWILSLTQKRAHIMTKYKMRVEDGWKSERVWCVTTESGNIITRRRGTVTVTGNTEGFDNPAVEVVIMARPTKSRSLYAQMAGRGTRPLPGVVDPFEWPEARKQAIQNSAKESLLIVDFVGNSGRHKLMSSADILGGKSSDEAVERAREIAAKRKGKMRMVEVLEEAEEQLRQERERAEQRRLAEVARRARIVGKAAYTKTSVSPFDVFQITPGSARGWDDGRVLSEKQRAILLKQGIDPNGMPYHEAKALLNEQFRRWDQGLATFKQCKLLQRRGVDTKNLTMVEAREMIDAIALKEGWGKPKPPSAEPKFTTVAEDYLGTEAA